MNLTFVHPGSIDQLTGGTIYDRNIIKFLHRCRIISDLHLVEIEGKYPVTQNRTQNRFRELLVNCHNILIVDGLACHLLYSNLDRMRDQTIIYLMHNPLQFGDQFTKKERQYLKKIELAVLEKCQGIIVTSQHTLNYVRKHMSHIPHIVIQPGKPQINDHKHIKKEKGNKLLTVGSVTPLKNTHTLLEVLEQVQTPVELDIVGRQPDEQYLQTIQNMIESLDQHIINIIGPTSEISMYYQNCDIFIHIPLIESYGMVLQEAMGYSLPIIASNVGGIPETVQQSAVLIDPTDKETIRVNLEKLLLSQIEREHLAKQSRKRFKQFPTWETQANRMIEFIREIVNS